MFKLAGKTHYSNVSFRVGSIIAGKTHYSNVSFRVGSIICTGLSALAFTSSPVLAFTGKLPTAGHI